MAEFGLVVVAFYLVLAMPREVRAFAVACVSLRIAIAVTNASGQPFLGAGNDAVEFGNRIVDLALGTDEIDFGLSTFEGGARLFIDGYAAILRLLGAESSLLAAHLISVVAASGCFVLLTRCWQLINPSDVRGMKLALLAYALFPSLLSYQSYILREVWQSLAVLMILYGALLWRHRGFDLGVGVLLLVGYAIGAAMHHSLPIGMGVLVLIALGLAHDITPSDLIHRLHVVLVALFSMAVLIGFGYVLTRENRNIQGLLNGTLIADTETFLDGGVRSAVGARATYGNRWDIGRPWTVLGAFAFFETAPFPWQIRTLPDLVVFAEHAVRGYMLWLWWSIRKRLPERRANAFRAIFVMWLSLELIWSLGTINWGTASRHQAMGQSLILILGLSARSSKRALARDYAAPKDRAAALSKGATVRRSPA